VNSSSDSRDGSEESAEDPNADLTGAEEGDRDGDGDREQNPRGKSPTDEEKGTEEAADTVNINGGTYAVVPIGISTPSLQHSLNLDSAAGYPVYTNYVEGFQDCLDYIHISSQHFRTVRVAPFPPVDVLSAHTALPSPAFPSDHLAVVVDLQYKKQGGEEITK
jgi:mRNA deadenylase 3'-5' endonuclease subunit Ccr4